MAASRFKPGRHVFRSRPGFTLIEVLAVIGVAATLLSLVLVSLRSARSSAMNAASLSNLRQNVAAMIAYSASHDGAFPVAAPLEQSVLSYVQVRFPDNSWFAVRYFDQTTFWHGLLAKAEHELTPTAFSPWNTAPDQGGTYWRKASDYVYSQSFLASPRYWTRDGEQALSMWRGCRLDEVAHPAQKSMFSRGVPVMHADRWTSPESGGLRVECGYVDGHAGTPVINDGFPCVPNRLYDDVIAPLLTTELGVSGRDA